ncbi:F-box domain-containing protein [Mycena indigotica]|uniref:F-box domain-containing protein n=1 Tax=Mycena indigotica TaxID=2126181 RepID=A0A8H6VWR4_9AGAR|nr:F-box domain-containing protein [Mycena indigotica]KAF7296879.1 F-box domain-containing protein [Mycena indigotica]
MSRIFKRAMSSKGGHMSLSKLPSLPTELLLEILAAADDETLHALAEVSKKFHWLAKESLLLRHKLELFTKNVLISSSDALRALRLALALRDPDPSSPIANRRPLHKFEYVPRDGLTNGGVENLRRLQALFNHLSPSVYRISHILLTFDRNLIKRPVTWNMGVNVPRLLQALCGQSPVAVIVSNTAIFTHKVRALRTWNPYTREPYCKLELHDGSKQWVATTNALSSIEAVYPFGPGDPATAAKNTKIAASHARRDPLLPWTLLIIDKTKITTLLLSVELTFSAWTAILSDPGLILPALHTVAIWSTKITPRASVEFLNRHSATLTTLTYMSPVFLAKYDYTTAPISWKKLQRLTAVAHYMNVLNTNYNLPSLTMVEIWPSDVDTVRSSLAPALQAVSRLPELDTLALWSLTEPDVSFSWPVLPNVRTLILQNVTTPLDTTRLIALLASALPALRSFQVTGGPHTRTTPARELSEEMKRWKEDLLTKMEDARNEMGDVRWSFD